MIGYGADREKTVEVSTDTFELTLKFKGSPVNWPDREQILDAMNGVLRCHGFIDMQEELDEIQDAILKMREELDGKAPPLVSYKPWPPEGFGPGTGGPMWKSNGTTSNDQSPK